MGDRRRCAWVGREPGMIAYHDSEWGAPVRDDRRHFEFLLLDSFQAGLSWAIILRKRAAFREAFRDFDPVAVSNFTDDERSRLLQNKSIVRNRQKIDAAIGNAARFLEIQAEFGTFDAFVWSFVGGSQLRNRWRTMDEVPTSTEESAAMSKALRGRGFKFVGPTICYAYMQGAGLVNDHTTDCYRHEEVSALAR